jgi:SAM-dependent methyltransferase
VRPWLARAGAHALVYGRCASCGHGLLQDGLEAASDAAIRARHASPDYFHTRDGEGAGYDAYAEEASYREAKGTKLVARLAARARGPLATLLEVGSGFGYTRAAAERAGVRTAGVDVNPHAGAEAKRRYGLATFHGTLEEALGAAAPAIAPGGFDAVLYQFVLEHVRDPVRELGAARRALRPGGQLALLVPSMAAAEIDVFGASYRSFRGDHRHLYTRASLGATLARVGLHLSVCESHCNIHLFRDLLSPSALERLYATGRGPDLWVIAEAST